jgi:hypothetical protein
MRATRPTILLIAALVITAFVVGLLTSVASAQQGVAVFTGLVRIDGANAPAGTVVIIRLQRDNREIGRAPTGAATGSEPNRYRIDIQGSAEFEGQTVVYEVETKYLNPPITQTFMVNRVITQDLNATATPPPPPPTATAPPAATPTTAPPTATPPPPPTPTAAATSTPLPTATTVAPATAVPTATRPAATPTTPPTAVIQATPTPAKSGGCNAPLARTGEIDAGWLLIGLFGPGALLSRRFRSKK